MSADPPKKSFGRRVLMFMLGSDEPSFVASAAGMSLVWGVILAFFIVYKSSGPSPAISEVGGVIIGGMVFGLFIMPFFFLTISRAILFMSPWEALATMTAAALCPLILWHLGARHGLGVNPILIIVGCIALVVGAFLTARVIEKRHRSN